MIESITSFLAGDGGLWALCVSAFLSSTVLPGSSEALLAAALASAPQTDRALLLVAAASLFNTLGSMTSWAPLCSPSRAGKRRRRSSAPLGCPGTGAGLGTRHRRCAAARRRVATHRFLAGSSLDSSRQDRSLFGHGLGTSGSFLTGSIFAAPLSSALLRKAADHPHNRCRCP